jgi:hypothetical protein
MDVNVGGSLAWKTWSKDSQKCGDHEQKMKQIDADISREASLRASDNPVDNALAHEQAKASSDAYKAGDAALTARVNTLTENGAKPLDINQNDGHKLMGYGAINIRKPVVTTVTPPSTGTACAPIVNVYLQAAQAARSTGKVAKVETPKVDTTCKLEIEQALKNAGVAAPKP